jgi:hypothetical protein
MRRDENFENIIIEGNPNNVDWEPYGRGFEMMVAELLATLRKSWTGWAVLRALYDRRKNKNKEDQCVYIVPMSPDTWKQTGGALGATGPLTPADATSASGRGLRGGDYPMPGERDNRYDPLPFKGTGIGSSCVVHFRPRGYRRPDCTLLHELVHAVRQMSGLMDRVPTDHMLSMYEDEEEIYPDLVKNIYLSERGEDDRIEFGHLQHKSMDEFLNSHRKYAGDFPADDPRYDKFREYLAPVPLTPAGLLNHPTLKKPIRRVLANMVRYMHDLCRNIALMPRATMKWNLLREFMDNLAKYPIL